MVEKQKRVEVIGAMRRDRAAQPDAGAFDDDLWLDNVGDWPIDHGSAECWDNSTTEVSGTRWLTVYQKRLSSSTSASVLMLDRVTFSRRPEAFLLSARWLLALQVEFAFCLAHWIGCAAPVLQ
jgi:hypothetical protein